MSPLHLPSRRRTLQPTQKTKDSTRTATIPMLTSYTLLCTLLLTPLALTPPTTHGAAHITTVAISLHTDDTRPDHSEQALHLINEERRRAGCSRLRPLPALDDAALWHSLSMARRNTLVHSTTPPDGTPRGWAENIARGYRTPTAVVTAWLNSPGHRRNLLNCAYHYSGLNMTRYEGGTWWTHILTS